jgi:hypothetical protein
MRRLFQLFRSLGGSRGRRPARPCPRPSLEALEDRLPLSSCPTGFGAAGHFGGCGWQSNQVSNCKVTGADCREAQHSSRCGSGTFTARCGHEADCHEARHSSRCGSGTFTARCGHEADCHETDCHKSNVNHIPCTPPSNTPPPPSSSASISGLAYVDNNGNGKLDGSDSELAGAIITLTDSAGNVISTTTTDASGSYSFNNLPAGTYTISAFPPGGYTNSATNVGTVNGVPDGVAGNGSVTGVVLQAGNQGSGYDFGFSSAS